MPNKFEPLIIGLAMITMGSTLTALLKPQASLWQTLRNWLAGIIAGALVMIFAYKNNYTGKVIDFVMIAVATFVTAIYPLLETLVKFYLVKKIEEKTGKKVDTENSKNTINETSA